MFLSDTAFLLSSHGTFSPGRVLPDTYTYSMNESLQVLRERAGGDDRPDGSVH